MGEHEAGVLAFGLRCHHEPRLIRLFQSLLVRRWYLQSMFLHASRASVAGLCFEMVPMSFNPLESVMP